MPIDVDAEVIANFIGIACAWVKRKAVNREKPHSWIGPKGILRRIAVMHVPIDDQYPIEREFISSDNVCCAIISSSSVGTT